MNLIFKNGWNNFIRNSYLSIGTIGVMSLSIILAISLIGLRFLTSEVTADLQDKVDVSVYFKTEANEDEILKVKDNVSKLEEVKSVVYISRDQALTDFKERHAKDDLIQESLRQLEVNPLGASLNILAKDASKYAAIVETIEKSQQRPAIDSINYYENKTVIEKIQNISKSIDNWGLLATILLATIAIFITFNTIRLTIYNQRKEIEIMKLVGASSKQVRGPYLVEGTLYGIFAALIGLTATYPIVLLLSAKINSFTSVDIGTYFIHNIIQIALIAFVFGILLGMFSSTIAIRKYLKN